MHKALLLANNFITILKEACKLQKALCGPGILNFVFRAYVISSFTFVTAPIISIWRMPQRFAK